jgi:hypothetical protein
MINIQGLFLSRQSHKNRLSLLLYHYHLITAYQTDAIKVGEKVWPR